MSSHAQQGFKVRHYSAPPGYPECLKPPALLLPMLADFQLPALPYWVSNTHNIVPGQLNQADTPIANTASNA
jgi:hypothetical protein